MKILNGWSWNMISEFPVSVVAKEISLEEARKLAVGGESSVGHTDTAAIFQGLLGVPVPMVRSTVSLKNETVLIGNYRGPRLPEGTTVLPPGATIQWLLVTVS